MRSSSYRDHDDSRPRGNNMQDDVLAELRAGLTDLRLVVEDAIGRFGLRDTVVTELLYAHEDLCDTLESAIA